MLNAFMPLRVPPRSCNPEPFPPHAAGFSPGRDAILAEHKGIGIESQVSGSALSIYPPGRHQLAPLSRWNRPSNCSRGSTHRFGATY